MGLLFVAAAVSFWIIHGKRAKKVGSPSAPAVSEVLSEGPSSSSRAPDSAPAPRPADTTTPKNFVRSSFVPRSAASDGVLRLLVLGDEQSRQWAEGAAATLQGRLSSSTGPWSQVLIDLTVQAKTGWTAADAWLYLEDQGWEVHKPELILASFGWHDSATERGKEVPLRDEHSARLEVLMQQAVFPDRRRGEHHFYVRRAMEGLEGEHLSPQHHLELLDGLAARAAERGAVTLFVEQPVRHQRGEREIFPSAAARPQPWLPTVLAMEQEEAGDELFARESGPELSPRGADVMGRYVGLGAAPAVLQAP